MALCGQRLILQCSDDVIAPDSVGEYVYRHMPVLTNLVDNALKFTERGGVTLIVATREHALDAVTVRVEVVDTGIGIDPDVVERIFNPYTQANYNTAMKFGGTGLGLAIMRTLLGPARARAFFTTCGWRFLNRRCNHKTV